MRATTKWVLAALAGLTLTAGVLRAQETQAAPEAAAAPAEEEKAWSLEFGLDYSTLYMFRGLNLLGEDQEVWTPRVVFTYGGFSAWYYGYYGKFDQFGEEGEPVSDGNYGEEDFGLDYTFEIGKMSLTLGGLTYMYPGEVERGLEYLDTWELYAIAAFDVPLAPTISYYQDIDEVDGGFLSLDLSHSFPAGDKVSFDFMGQIGFDFGYNQPGDSELDIDGTNGDLNHAMLGLDVPWQITDSFSMHAMVQQFWSLDVADDLEQPDETVFTVGATYGF